MQERELTLVIGGTAGTGHEIVTRLLRNGCRVRAMTRHPDSARQTMENAVDLVPGDLTRPETLSGAVEGAHHIIATAGLPRRFIPRGRATALEDQS